jgi:hypothetical protein
LNIFLLVEVVLDLEVLAVVVVLADIVLGILR